jgi:hypothetical protein
VLLLQITEVWPLLGRGCLLEAGKGQLTHKYICLCNKKNPKCITCWKLKNRPLAYFLRYKKYCIKLCFLTNAPSRPPGCLVWIKVKYFCVLIDRKLIFLLSCHKSKRNSNELKSMKPEPKWDRDLLIEYLWSVATGPAMEDKQRFSFSCSGRNIHFCQSPFPS